MSNTDNTFSPQEKLFLSLTHYSIQKPTSPWYLNNGGNTGIGNMLFQIASSFCFSVKNNAQLFVPGLEIFFENEKIVKTDSIFRNINTECPEEYTKQLYVNYSSKEIGLFLENAEEQTSYRKITKYENNYHPSEFKYLDVSEFPMEYMDIHKNVIVSNDSNGSIWDNIFKYRNNLIIHCLFENWRNFNEYRTSILELFRPSQEDNLYITNKYPEILNQNVCSIHVRLGPDYKQIYQSNYQRLVELQHGYLKSLDHMIETKHIDTCFVFTNDPEYCQNLFDKNHKYSGIKFIYSQERDFVDIWMISLIKNNIVSVSTLAWWGSFLNECPDQYIVCCKGNRDDLHYPGWVVI